MYGRYEVGGADAPSHLPAGGAESLSRGGDGDGAVPHAGEGCKVHVSHAGGGQSIVGFGFILFFGRRVDNVLVHLIQDYNALRTSFDDIFSNAFHFGVGEYLARGIVWRIEYDGTCLGRNFTLQLFMLQYPFTTRDNLLLCIIRLFAVL